MTITEAVEIIDDIGRNVNIALYSLQSQRFQFAFEVGCWPIFDLLETYKAAIGLLIERNRIDLLERLCREIYESACKAEPLLEQAKSNCKTIGETEVKGSLWATFIKRHWEAVVLPILQTDAEAPHCGRPKDVSISWLVENPDGHLEVIHDLADGKRGVKFFCFIKAAVLEGWFNRPPYRAIKKEFGDIGSRSRYDFYMGNPYNEKELEQLRATLKLRHQNL